MAKFPRLRLYSSSVRGRQMAVIVVATLGLAACSSSPSRNATKPSTTPAPSSSVAPTTTTTVEMASDLPVTDAIRSQLVAAGATLNSLPVSDYTGLRPGETYYAYDKSTLTYWAGAGLMPSPSSTPAQVSSQDDGAYLLFDRVGSGPWKAYAVGLAGTPDGGACPIAVPVVILDLWGWSPKSCRPPTIS